MSFDSKGPARARALGVAPGLFRPGPHNALTDVAGVLVGHATVIEGDSVRTGVTAIRPHGGNVFRERVPAAIVVGNGFGKLLGSTQVNELGELETPLLLTNTLSVWRAADALVDWMLSQPGMEDVRSLNPVSVGAGTGTVAFGWKGGIGTASRVLPASLGGHTVGVLVQSNFGGVLQVLGVPVGRELGRYSFQGAVEDERGDGSILIVVATDAPLTHRPLQRLASRALLGLGRTGSCMANGSGDYVIAFSTAEAVRRRGGVASGPELPDEALSPLFQAVVEATEEAIYDSLFTATEVTGQGVTVKPLPLERVRELLARYHAVQR